MHDQIYIIFCDLLILQPESGCLINNSSSCRFFFFFFQTMGGRVYKNGMCPPPPLTMPRPWPGAPAIGEDPGDEVGFAADVMAAMLVGKNKAFSSAGNLTVLSSKFYDFFFVGLSPNMAALSRGCKPRIYKQLGRQLTDTKHLENKCSVIPGINFLITERINIYRSLLP